MKTRPLKIWNFLFAFWLKIRTVFLPRWVVHLQTVTNAAVPSACRDTELWREVVALERSGSGVCAHDVFCGIWFRLVCCVFQVFKEAYRSI